ncbi:MAG TPA: PspC domain-containing protein [Chloroflexota bacterium]|nr:PspC domain-containing protein [Chloroflexota bacterium]
MTKRLYKSRTDRMIAGVCGGLAEYFDIDPVLVRLLFLLLAFLTGTGFIIYPILWIVMPEQTSLQRPPRDVVWENIGKMQEDVERIGEEIHAGTRGSTVATEGSATEGTTVEERITENGGRQSKAGEPGLEGTVEDRSYYDTEPYNRPHRSRTDRQFIGGVILLVLGVILLMQNLGIFWWASVWRLWPLVLVAIGVYLLYKRSRPRL